MADPFVDTDVIVRLLTGDDPRKQALAMSLFELVEAGKLTLSAPDTVIFDVVYVLASRRLYGLPRDAIREVLVPILRLANFKIENKRALLAALDLYASTTLPFGDAMIVASMDEANSTILYSYDTDFDRHPNVERREPGALS
jgi:predicted nucleic acid-binding protein